MKVNPVSYDISKEDIDWVFDKWEELVNNKEFLTDGKYCREFEQMFAKYVGTRYALSTSSGTSALELIFRAIGIKGKEVVVPSNTFGATAFAAVRAGGILNFADVSKDDLCLNVDYYGAKGAVCLVHVGGIITERIEEILKVCDREGIYLVEDSAHAHGSVLGNKRAGSFGIASAFSFFPTKVMTTGEGGMITSNDKELIARAKVIGDQAKINNKNYHYEIGYNCRMNEFEALLGLAQLSRLNSIIVKRTKIAKIYDDMLNSEILEPLKLSEKLDLNYYKYIKLLSKGIPRDDFKDALKSKGISMTGEVYDLPLHRQPCFSSFAYRRLPVSEDVCGRMVCFPISSTMTEEEAKYVCEIVNEYEYSV